MLASGALLQDRYQIVRSIARGGMGAVYQATDQRLGNTVAIKQILHGDAALRAAFAREARLLATLRHPALPKVTDYFSEPVGQFLVMEFVPGDDLATRMLRQREALAVDVVLGWAEQLLAVLTYLHNQEPPVIHRDIKPHNLKLNDAGEVILLDFGLAKGGAGQIPADKSLGGYSLHYASPEQLRGEQTDARSDLYALAATFYDLLSTVKPPDALKRLTAIAAGDADPLQSLELLNPILPAPLADVFHRALALAPEERFRDAASMRMAIQVAEEEATQVVLAEDAPHRPRHNLPAQLTPFVGRAGEVADVTQMLQDAHVRLVTLVGPGGIGKTRMALSVAVESLAHFQDGVFFVSLAPIRETHLVLPAIAQTLGLREAPNTPLLQSLQAHLQHLRVLLVLDNFEQVIGAAPLISTLLTACPSVKVLVTSRAVLQVRGEHEFPVPALTVPDAAQLPPIENLAQCAAVKLFIQRAQSVKPNFTLNSANAAAIVEICARLDGLPLAIELAAAYIKFLPAPAILARLTERIDLLSSGSRDVPDRQRTLGASIGWSYDLLDPSEQILFRRLSIFMGSFNLDAAEALCRGTGVEIDALAGIASLIDKSLLKSVELMESEPRFTMLETIREFGLRQLAEEGESERVGAFHADHFFQLARKAERDVWGANIADAVRRLDVENDNLRAALNHYLGHEEGAVRSLLLAGSLWRFWEMRGYMMEGRAWLDRALQRSAQAPPSSRWLPLHGAGNLAVDQGEYEVAKRYYQESLDLLQNLLPTLDDPDEIRHTRRGIANTFINLGNIALLQSEYDRAVTFTEQALEIHRQLDNKIGLAIAINNLANVKLHQSSYAQAEALSVESLQLHRELGDDRGIGWNLERLGTIARDRGDYARAEHLYAECNRIFEKLSNQADMAALHFNWGEVARQQGAFIHAETHYQAGLTLAQTMGNKKERARLLNRLGMLACGRELYIKATELNEQSILLQREIGDMFGLCESLHTRGDVARAQQQYAAAATSYAESLQLKARLGYRKGIVDAFIALSALAVADRQQHQRAARLLAAAATLCQSIGTSIPPSERQAYDELHSTLRTTLTEACFTATWAAGEAMDLEQGIRYALEVDEPCSRI